MSGEWKEGLVDFLTGCVVDLVSGWLERRKLGYWMAGWKVELADF